MRVIHEFISMNKYYKIGNSKIHGQGIIAVLDLPEGQIVDMAIGETNNITDFGSYINHSSNPSAKLVKTDNGYNVVTTRDIKNGEEITADYNDTPSFISKPDPSWTN